MLSKTSPRTMHPTMAFQDLVSRIAQNPLFDKDWYLANTPGARLSNLDPAYYYLWIGSQLGYVPGPDFDTTQYLAAHSDVKDASINPLLHLAVNGQHGPASPVLSDATPGVAHICSFFVACGMPFAVTHTMEIRGVACR
jgi:hypothetical protein